MQISFSTTDHRAELKALTLMLGSLCGMTVIDPNSGETTAPAPQPLPAADLPSTGADTTQMGFAAIAGMPAPNTGAALPPIAPQLPPLVVPPTQGGAVELDASGLPHDPRIHAGTKRKNADGTWTKKKGLNDASLIARVEAELRATLPSATPAPTNVAPVFPQPTVTPAAAPAPALQPLPAASPVAPALSPLPILPTVPVAAAPAAIASAPTSPSPTNMQEFMQQVAPLMQSGRVTADTINMACMTNNLPGMAALTTATAEQIGKVWAELTK